MGADVVFVHGFTQTGTSWAPVSGLVSASVLTPDVPEGADFVAVAHALDEGAATYVGYSQGGRLCLQLALDRPDVVQRLVLISASPGIADNAATTNSGSSETSRAPAARASRRAADERLAQEIERDGVDAFLARWLAQPLFATLPPDRAGLDERRAHNTVAGLTSQLRVLGQGAQPSNWERLGELKVPVLLIVGAHDRKYVDIAERMAEHIADARVEVIYGAGHACHLEQPERVAHVLTSFVA